MGFHRTGFRKTDLLWDITRLDCQITCLSLPKPSQACLSLWDHTAWPSPPLLQPNLHLVLAMVDQPLAGSQHRVVGPYQLPKVHLNMGGGHWEEVWGGLCRERIILMVLHVTATHKTLLFQSIGPFIPTDCSRLTRTTVPSRGWWTTRPGRSSSRTSTTR